MEKTEESVGIRVYTTATPPQKPSPPLTHSPKPVSISSLPTLPVGAAAGGGREIPVSDDRYTLRVNDFVHAMMSVLVFMAIAFSDRRVTGCLFPGKEKEMDQVMESFPLMVGIVCSALFLVFPTTRYGVGCMSA
ncbi:unnamed protein product [Brassica oleracea var. botrytis]